MAPDDAAREAGRDLLGFVLAPTVLLHFGPNLVTACIAFARVVHHCRTPLNSRRGRTIGGTLAAQQREQQRHQENSLYRHFLCRMSVQTVGCASSRRADGLRTEWQAIAQAVVATRAAHPAGRRAKANALHAYHQHVGGTKGIEIDLAQSLVEDLVNADSE